MRACTACWRSAGISGPRALIATTCLKRGWTYHVMVLMVQAGISLEEVREELAGRHVIDHKVKQEKMASDQA